MLDNPQHEAFAQNLARGSKPTAAYVLAGYKKSPAAATRLSKAVKIQDRVFEIQSDRAEAVTVTVDRALRELTRVGLVDPRRFFDTKGEILPPSKWSDDMAAAVKSIEVIERRPRKGARKPLRSYKLQFWPKMEALALIAKHLGMLIDRSESRNLNTTIYSQMSEQELALELTAMTLQARKRGAVHD